MTAASRSNGTRRPSTDAADDDAPHLGVESVDLVAHDARRRSTAGVRPPGRRRRGRRRWPRAPRGRTGCRPCGVWSASTARNDGSCSNTAARNVAHVGRAEPGELQVGHRVAPVEPRQQVGGGVASGESVGAVGADHHERSAVGLGEELEGGQALRVGPVEVFEHDERGATGGEGPDEVDACPHPLLGGSARVLDHGCAARGGCSRRSLPRASRNSSIGRPTVPGSAWPASTSVPAGALATSSCTSRVLPMPASPAISATAGTDEVALQGTQPPQLGRATDHDR